MATSTNQLSQDIATLERQLSESTNEILKKALVKKITRLKEELRTGQAKSKELLSALSKARKDIANIADKDFKGLITKLSKQPEYAFLKDYTLTQVKNDLKEEAKPVGYRFVGDNMKKPTPAQVKKGLKDGTVYWEGRPERSDVSRVAKLEKGGNITVNVASIKGVIKKAVDGKSDRTTEEKGSYRVDMVYDYGDLRLTFYYLDYNNPRFSPSVEHYANFNYEGNTGTFEIVSNDDIYTTSGKKVSIKPVIEKTIEALKSLDYSVDEIIDEYEMFEKGGAVDAIIYLKSVDLYLKPSNMTFSSDKNFKNKEDIKNLDEVSANKEFIENISDEDAKTISNKMFSDFFKKNKMEQGGSVKKKDNSEVEKTIAFFSNYKFQILDGKLGFQDVKKLIGITPSRIEHISYKTELSDNNEAFADYSIKALQKLCNCDEIDFNLIYSIDKENGVNTITKAFAEFNGQPYKFNTEEFRWEKSDKFAKGGNIEAIVNLPEAPNDQYVVVQEGKGMVVLATKFIPKEVALKVANVLNGTMNGYSNSAMSLREYIVKFGDIYVDEKNIIYHKSGLNFIVTHVEKFAKGGNLPLKNLDKIKNSIGETIYNHIGSLNKQQLEKQLSELQSELLQFPENNQRYYKLKDEEFFILHRLDRANEFKYEKGGSIDPEFTYMMLSRLQMDNEYFLGHGNRNEKQLWAGNVDDQIAEMKKLWNSLNEKPEWLTMEQIEEYEHKMKNEEFAKGGSLTKPLYVQYSSLFDTTPYDTEKIISTLESIGAKNIRLEAPASNQPEVVVFEGSKSQAEDALNEAFDTDWIIIREKDFRKAKFENGGGVGYKSSIKEKVDFINSNYDGVEASVVKNDNRIKVVSKFFFTISEIKRNEFNGNALVQKEANNYVLYSNKAFFAKGGKINEEEHHLDLLIKELTSKYPLKAEGIKKWLSDNNLSKDDLVAIISGLGRKIIDINDFTTAIVGETNNEYSKAIIDFAKSGKAYELPKTTTSDKTKEIGNSLRFKKGDEVYVFQHANNSDKDYIVGKGNAKQTWAKVEILEPVSDEKGWERYKVKLTDGIYRNANDEKIKKGEELVAYQSSMSVMNKRPIPIGYDSLIIIEEEEEGFFADGTIPMEERHDMNLLFKELHSKYNLRIDGIKKWVTDNKLTKSDLVEIINGLETKKIDIHDMIDAYRGEPNNEYSKAIIDFAKSGKAYELPKTAISDRTKEIEAIGSKIRVGDVLWDKEHKDYGTVLDVFKEDNEVRLDSDGVVSIYEYDKDWNHNGLNLIQVGAEGDEGTIEEFQNEKRRAKNLIDQAKERVKEAPKDKFWVEKLENYTKAFQRLLNGDFDEAVKNKANATFVEDYYIPHANIISVTYKDGKKNKTVGVNEVLNGVNLKFDRGGTIEKTYKYISHRDIINVVVKGMNGIEEPVALRNDEFLNGFWVKKDATPLKEPKMNNDSEDLKLEEVNQKDQFAKGGTVKPVEFTDEKGNTFFINGTNADVERMYLDYRNNFITLKAFADHYDISEKQAENIIERGRELNNNKFEEGGDVLGFNYDIVIDGKPVIQIFKDDYTDSYNVLKYLKKDEVPSDIQRVLGDKKTLTPEEASSVYGKLLLSTEIGKSFTVEASSKFAKGGNIEDLDYSVFWGTIRKHAVTNEEKLPKENWRWFYEPIISSNGGYFMSLKEAKKIAKHYVDKLDFNLTFITKGEISKEDYKNFPPNSKLSHKVVSVFKNYDESYLEEFAKGGYIRPSNNIKTTGKYKFETKDKTYHLEVAMFEREGDDTDSLQVQDELRDELGSIIIKNNAWSKLSNGKTVEATASKTKTKGKLTRMDNLFANGGNVNNKKNQLRVDNIKMLENGCSDAYIEAKLYEKYKNGFSIKQISEIMTDTKNNLTKYKAELKNKLEISEEDEEDDKIDYGKSIHEDIIKMLEIGYSDAYIEAKLYGIYRNSFSIKQISKIVKDFRNNLPNVKDKFAEGGNISTPATVDGFKLVYEKDLPQYNPDFDNVSGTIRTSPQNNYVASVNPDKTLDFKGIDGSTKNIDQSKVIELWESNQIPQSRENEMEMKRQLRDYKPKAKLRSIRVTFDNGKVIYTDMASGLSDEEMLEYYKVGKEFNIGNGAKDVIAKVVSAEITDNEHIFEKGGNIEPIDMEDVERKAHFYTDESRWSVKPTIEGFQDEIKEMEELKRQLDAKEITPSKVIGTGHKSYYARAIAEQWIEQRILVAKRAIEILEERKALEPKPVELVIGLPIKFSSVSGEVKEGVIDGFMGENGLKVKTDSGISFIKREQVI